MFHDSIIFSFSHVFNVTLDFNSLTVIAVFIAVLTSFDTDRFS